MKSFGILSLKKVFSGYSQFAKPLILICSFFIVFTFPAHAQDEEQYIEQFIEQPALERREVFFIAPLAEAIGYSYTSIAYGGGLAIGSGSGTAVGLRFLYATDPENYIFMEILFFLRFYFLGSEASTGPFLQFNGGPVIYADSVPELSGYGGISAGLNAGWRLPIGRNFFIEPAVRVGYPYIVGGGISSGLRF